MKIINKALFSYFGNKDRESKQIMENLPDMNNIDIVIEPYCGSFSLIRNLILLYPDKKYICVDNDKKLIQAYNDIIDDDKYNKILNNLKNTEIKTKEEYDIYRKINTTESYIYYNSVYTIRPGLFNRQKIKMNDNNLSKLETFNKYNKNIEFICDDAKNIIEEYKNNYRVFMFIDPPYLLNNIYDSTHRSDYILNFIKDFNNCNCKIIAVLGNHVLLKVFYEHYCLNIKFTTEIRFQNHHNIDKIPYIANY